MVFRSVCTIFSLSEKILPFSDLKVQSVALQSKILKLIWYFAHLFVSLQREMKKIKHMEPKIGDRMKVSPQLTDQADWIDGEVIDVEHNPFMGPLF